MVISTIVYQYVRSNTLQCCGPDVAFVSEGFFDLAFLHRCPSIQCTRAHDVSCKKKRRESTNDKLHNITTDITDTTDTYHRYYRYRYHSIEGFFFLSQYHKIHIEISSHKRTFSKTVRTWNSKTSETMPNVARYVECEN